MKYLKTYPRTFPVTCIPGFADVTPFMMTTEPSLKDLRLSNVFAREHFCCEDAAQQVLKSVCLCVHLSV